MTNRKKKTTTSTKTCCHARQRTDLFKLQVKSYSMDISKYQKKCEGTHTNTLKYEMGIESLSSSLGKICYTKWSKPKHYKKCYFNAGRHTI
jgi:hypothetical protein